MPTTIIRDITVTVDSVQLTVELIMAYRQIFSISLSLTDWTVWKEENPTGTVLQFVTQKIQERVSLLDKMLVLFSGLKGKEITW